MIEEQDSLEEGNCRVNSQIWALDESGNRVDFLPQFSPSVSLINLRTVIGENRVSQPQAIELEHHLDRSVSKPVFLRLIASETVSLALSTTRAKLRVAILHRLQEVEMQG
jgi:hypothetical protein